MAGGGSVIICKIHSRLRTAGGWVAAHRPLSGSFLRKFTRSIGHSVFENARPRLLHAPCDECDKNESA